MRISDWSSDVCSSDLGFMEPGETMEEAVRREIFEEAGIPCGAVRYIASQPWPFPSSLMLGCVAEATAETIAIDPQELEEARWSSREQTAGMLERATDPAVRKGCAEGKRGSGQVELGGRR